MLDKMSMLDKIEAAEIVVVTSVVDGRAVVEVVKSRHGKRGEVATGGAQALIAIDEQLVEQLTTALRAYHDEDECVFGAHSPSSWEDCDDPNCRFCRTHELLAAIDMSMKQTGPGAAVGQ